jgi:hypothetical protein
VNPLRLIIALQNVKSPAATDSDCENLVMIFPSRKTTVKNGCGLDAMEKNLNGTGLWRDSFKLARGTFKVFNIMNDTIDGSTSLNNMIMSISTPIYDQNKPNTSDAIGIMVI